ncbi:AbrB family transcriptional regulator [Actinoplanes sp. NBRC 101535]|nr:AbrB family transcriptional regulator [Actinoplanes sp. NBRC 101535]
MRRTVKDLTGGAFGQDPGAATRYHGFVSVQSRGTVALPPEVRRRYGLNEPGSQVEITERSDGVLELRPTIAIPASQQWFWEKRWQEGERRADADIAAGRTTTYENVDDFMDSLDLGE